MTSYALLNNQSPVTSHTVDYHCHILPGLDDGATDLGQSLSMAQALVAAGYWQVCCTPHCIRGVWDNSATGVRAATAVLQGELELAGIPLVLHPGMEYYLDEFLPEALDEPLLLPGGLLLVELPSRCDSHVVQRILAKVVQRGLIPLIAHPERCHQLEPIPEPESRVTALFGSLFNSKLKIQNSKLANNPLIASLQQLGCQFQGDLGSLKGYYGARARESALNLQARGVYSHWGSDAHNVQQLQAVLSGEK